jgi:hypothetical protein
MAADGHRPITRNCIVWAVLFVLAAGEASACPICTYERQLATYWHIKWVAINLLVPMVVAANRLDLVRLLYVLIPYVFFTFEFHSFLFWHTFSIQNPVLYFLAQMGWLILAFNGIGVALLFLVSRYPFFCWNKDQGLGRWQPIAYSLAVLCLSFVIQR